MITQQPRSGVPVPGTCGFWATVEEGRGEEGEANGAGVQDPTPPPQAESAGEVGARKLTYDEKRWIEEIKVLITEVRMAPVGEEKEIAREELEDYVMKMALTYNGEGNGRTPEGWTRLVTHLSQWSIRDPLVSALKKCATIMARKAAKRLAAGQRSTEQWKLTSPDATFGTCPDGSAAGPGRAAQCARYQGRGCAVPLWRVSARHFRKC